MKTTTRAGYTLIETMIALTILVAVLGTATTLMQRGQRAFDSGVSNCLATSTTSRALNRVVRRLRSAGAATILPVSVAPLSNESISFREAVGMNGEVTLWSQDIEIRLEYEPDELDNGLDDDGDGFVDECQAVLTENLGQADEKRVVLARGVSEFLDGEIPDGEDRNGNGLVDERGLCFEVRGDAIVVRLSMQRRNPEGGITVRTLEGSVWLRN